MTMDFIFADMDSAAMEYLEELRQERGWTLDSLAKKCGISPSTLRSARKRGSHLSLSSVKSLCDAFGIPMSEFVETVEKRAPFL